MNYKEEAPYVRPGYDKYGFDSKKEWVNTSNEFLQDLGRLLENYKDESNPSITYPVYKKSDDNVIALIHDKLIQFYVGYDYIIINNVKCTFQYGIWKNKEFKGNINKLATHVFWKYLFEMDDAITTSNEQYQDGMKFWIRRIEEALNQTSYYVYMINLKLIKPKFEIITKDNFEISKDDIFGYLPYYQYRRVIISKNKLA